MENSEPNSRILHKLQEFCKINEQFNIIFNKVEKNTNLGRYDLNEIHFHYIAHELLHITQYLKNIVNHFSEELPRLTSSVIFFDNDYYKFSWDRHIINTILLGNILKLRPDLSGYALKYFDLYPSPFEQIFECDHTKKSRKERNNNLTELDFVESCYFLLLSNLEFYKQKWNWSKFVQIYTNHSSQEIIWITAKCIALLNNLDERQTENLIHCFIPEKVHNAFTYVFDKKSTLVKCIELPQIDSQPVVNMSVNGIVQTTQISGMYVPTKPHVVPTESTLIEVESSKNNLRKILIGMSLNKAVCLQGPVGCGKTSLVEYLAAKTGRILGKDFIKIQLGDQMDTKTLLGTYRCTDIPGEFVWQPGVLTQAVMEGSWLLMEDVDSANMDIASVLSCLMENKSLSIPGFSENVPIKPGFQLFLTRRFISTLTGHHKKVSNPVTFMKKHLIQINIDPFSSDELKEIVLKKHIEFRFITDKLIEVFGLFNDNTKFSKNSRLISTRDFFKWCSRAVMGFNPKSQASTLKVLQDAIDIFCCSFPQHEDVVNLAKCISSVLGIINQKAEYFCLTYKPTIELTRDSFVVGRASMLREKNEFVKNSKFSFTRPAAVLLERIMCCVNATEPVLLVGETGTGKTSTVQYLASTLGQKLIVINMNQQSDSADLLGGFKPVDLKYLITPLKEEFEQVFGDYFKVEPNRKFLTNIAYCYNSERWSDLIKLMQKSYEVAISRLRTSKPIQGRKRPSTEQNEAELEKNDKKNKMISRWKSVGEKLSKMKSHLKQKSSLAFAFIEGTLVKAIQNGYWVLLDEINLANAETLECLSGLLEDSNGSLCLLERGDKEPIKRHPKFILFACMNPSTDVGKRDIPAGLRNRFTEFFIQELTERNDLLLLVVSYLESLTFKEKELNKIVDFYLKVRKEADTNLLDGIGHKPHYSLRSLCRALSIASKNPCGMLKRSLYEAFCLSFLTQLNDESYKIVQDMITSYLLGKDKEVKAVLNQPIIKPSENSGVSFEQFEGYWVQKGNLECVIPDNYILTESVRKNLRDLVRVVSIGKLPVLLQGDTSVGKTSLITYVAKASGNKCVRINNHEHTDLQEYIGSYVADIEGKLVFREGLLVEAMRQGHWIILDELNLAPTDVLEALNRVLDDNRELFIPETQQVVKAHQNFMLFATQNPPGAYGGRKMLSRAFRNRFVELHFTEIPPKELEIILQKRCEIAPSYSKKMINVMTELQMRRRGSATFAGKQGFITLRDLFRWGERYRLAQNTDKLYDWDQHLADEGYLVLAGKVRKSEERKEIISVLMKHLKREVEPENLFTLSHKTSTVTRAALENIYENSGKSKNIVWTFSMRQLAVLVAKGLQFKEPVLLVGETGGGKTTVCNILAENNGQRLMTVNCHMHSESSDFIGGLRPVRNHEESGKLFEWVNGPLIQAMQNGDVFLADEISLADDSVLERLNSLLEPERCLLLAEKGADINNFENSELVQAHDNFYFIGTMNPGGDFGKKELSPALRNRFTEIWCEPCTARNDLIDIVEANVRNGVSFGNQEDGSSGIGRRILDFVEWFKSNEIGKKFTISIRDILTWVNFINNCASTVEMNESYVHGACLTFLDSFGSGVTSAENSKQLEHFYKKCISILNNQMKEIGYNEVLLNQEGIELEMIEDKIGINPFFIDFDYQTENLREFFFNAPTTLFNTMRVLRGMQLNKAILLEGSPGVGKTSLITALAEFSGHKIYRINLSDQTDISDLFGADLPVEGGTCGQFSWKDGPLLQALKQGRWILLDELNLASQSVLEGLNACLDHRGEIFIPELNRTFNVERGTRFFAAQNPLKQGGSRRGLPQSFLNRFIQVYIHILTEEDLYFILTQQFTQIPNDLIRKMIEFNCAVEMQLNEFKFGNKGAPWECNLRDLTRWCEATIFHSNESKSEVFHPEALVHLLYGDRMRSLADKETVNEIFESVFKVEVAGTKPILYFNNERVFFGDVSLIKSMDNYVSGRGSDDANYLVLRNQLPILRSLCYCVNLSWMSILVGSSGCGKSSVVKTLANLAGKTLKTFPVTSAMDTTDILGGFEQTDYTRHLDELTKDTEVILNKLTQNLFLKGKTDKAVSLLELWESFLQLQGNDIKTIPEEVQLFLVKLDKLNAVWDRFHELRPSKLIEKLRRKGLSLKECVKKDKTLNAGGKFEWVDSILIKCLQNGYWLMVDNVNLCSSAVLDRLNALLEPNGVLSIGERGMDKNGKMIEIKPHKDFRLFLTMDPKNGEISRAMRNRGVEIYILNDRESSVKNDYDLKSMVHLNGLNGIKHMNVLLEMHEFFDELIMGEKPTVNELLQAASLISQQLRYGMNENKAFFTTLIEVYYKTRSSIEFNTNDIFEVLKVKLANSLEKLDLQNNWFNEYFTIPANHLKTCSMVEKFKQESALLHSLMRMQISVNDVKIQELFLVMFYTRTTKNDLEKRHDYIKYILDGSDANLSKLSDEIFAVLRKCSKFPAHLPIDFRWLPDTSYFTEDKMNVNQMILELFLILLHHNERKITKTAHVSLLDYMKSRKMNKVEDKFNDVIISNFIELFQTFDLNLQRVLSESEFEVTNESFLKILFLLTWRFSFFKCALVDINKQFEQSKILTTIRVHYHWFFKYSVKEVMKILGGNVNEKLSSILKQINAVEDKKTSGLFKIGKNYQKFIHKPAPFIDEEKLKTMEDYEKICCFYNMSDDRNNFETLCQIMEDEYSNIRNLLIDFKLNEENLRNKMDVLQITHSKNKDKVQKQTNKHKIELIPFHDYLERLQMRKFISSESVADVHLKSLRITPTELITSFIKFNSSKDSRFVHELLKNYFLYLNNSPCCQLKMFLNEGCEEETKIILSGHHPVLSYYLCSLLMNSYELNLTKLGNFRDSMLQQRVLNLTLWKNVKNLHCEDNNFISTETKFIRKDSRVFIEQLSSSFSCKELKSSEELVEYCLSHIQSFKNDLTSEKQRSHLEKFMEILQNSYEKISKLDEIEADEITEKVHSISTIHINLGYLKLVMNAQLNIIDPLMKKSLKRKYYEESIQSFERLKMCYQLQNDVFSGNVRTIHELYGPIKTMIEELMKKKEILAEYVAVRLENIEYESVLKSVNHALASILSLNSFAKIEEADFHIENLLEAIKSNEEFSLQQTYGVLSKLESAIPSYENLILDWTKYRVSYPDIIEPLLCNIAQLLYGYKMKSSLLKKLVQQYQYDRKNINVNLTLKNLVCFPFLDGNQVSYIEHVKNYTSDQTHDFVEEVLEDSDMLQQKNEENFRLLKCGIQEMFNACVINGSTSDLMNKKIFNEFLKLSKKFIQAYNSQEERKEEQQKEAESLYKTKIKCQELPEEQQIEEEMKELFPNFHVIDFPDLQKNVRIEDDNNCESHPDKENDAVSAEISYDDLKFVSELHMTLLRNFIKSEWLNPEKDKSTVCNFIKPLIEKFKVFRKIMDKTLCSLNFTMDKELFGSFNVLLGYIQSYGKDEILDTSNSPPKSQKEQDFYNDSDVDEVKSCFHILEELKIKINALLDEWPEQPTLKMIMAVIERIYKFNITSPVSRFLTGFEILLSKCHEWEQVAHSGVSLAQYEQNLIAQIISWRKKELVMWKNLLNSTFSRLNEDKAKWWLYLYKVTEQFIFDEIFTVEELITTLQKFITTSNIAEFESRLDLLYAFHCHTVIFDNNTRNSKKRIYYSVLWNIYQYYDQYRSFIVNRIKELRSPIEKKLKDYVKIVKWKDVSYWSVKETVDKSHKILHKHVREFKDVMKQSVIKYLVHTNTTFNKDTNVGIWDRPQRHIPKTHHYTLDSTNYVAKKSTIKKTDANESSEILSKIDAYFRKSRQFCKEIIETTTYSNLVRNLDEFVTDVIETGNHLQNLEVDTSIPKNKQKSQAKNILQIKHRALSDLFKTLSKIGLSYRTGIVDNTTKKSSEDFTIKPIDLKASLNHIGANRNDEKILVIWDSCELYFTRSLIRFNTLENALLQPAKDLGTNNIQRCQGYSAHLLSLSQKQKTEMIEMSRTVYYLKHYFNNISKFCHMNSFFNMKYLEGLKVVLENVILTVNQYKIILNTCPIEGNLEINTVEIMKLSFEKDEFIQYKHDSIWTKAYDSLGDMIKIANKTLTSIQKSIGTVPCTEYNIISPSIIPIQDDESIKHNLEQILSLIDDISSIFKETQLSTSLKWLHEQISQHLNDSYEISKESISDEILKKEIEKSSTKILYVIQEMYKKYSKLTKPVQTGDDEELHNLEDDCLKKSLVEELLLDVQQLDYKKILKSVSKIADYTHNADFPLNENVKLALTQYLSLVEQIILLYQYFLTQQVSSYRVTCKLNSVLLNIFIELAGKGFCVPPEFSEEMDGEGSSQPSDGMGLSEGKGEKDISDQIETEDQLDDAKLQDQEQEKGDDPDCEEEENGIEMSEDFDSKLQDKKEKKDDEENDDENSDSDAEEQMGETGQGADKLDEEIWGSDKEDENEEDDLEDESGNKGEHEQDQQIGAKEKDSKNQPENAENEEKGDEKEKNKNEINEMDEPEYDEEQIDPYHGNLPEPPEPEPMELPEDLNLDDCEEKDGEQEENPFDIDNMKEPKVPEQTEGKDEEDAKDKQKDEVDEFSSDDENIDRENTEERDNEESENDKPEEVNEESKSGENEELQEGENEDMEDENPTEESEKSGLDQNQTNAENVEAMDVDDSEATDKTPGTEAENKANQPIDNLNQEDKPDQDGMGQSQMEESRSGHSSQTNKPQETDTTRKDTNEETKRKQKPGESDNQRSLGDTNEPVKKKLKTIDEKNNDNDQDENEEKGEAEMYKHIKEAKENTTQTLDVATKEQAELQKEQIIPDESEEMNEDPPESSRDLIDENEDESIDTSDIAKQKPEKTQSEKKKERKSHPDGDVMDELENVNIEGDVIETSTVQRGEESTHHTVLENEKQEIDPTLTIQDINLLRNEVEQQMSSWYEPPSDLEAEQAWQKISSVTTSLAQELSEQLRLVLEPTQASRLKGDYRTGRRINMRKVIPYIASQFRKDKIWLRRTKPSKREYQIVLAIDDSSSMTDNKSKEMAFESIALISKALSLLESGQLSILSFGERTEILHKLTEQFTEKSGVKLLQKFKFDQTKTCLSKLVDFVTEMMEQSQHHSTALNAKLLVIVSDGRGVFSEGETAMRQAVRRGKLANIFTVFVIIDNPENKNSVLDIRMPVFKDGKLLEIKNYMDVFPFSFYILLRNLNSLPYVLSDALRQWFEMISNLDRQ